MQTTRTRPWLLLSGLVFVLAPVVIGVASERTFRHGARSYDYYVVVATVLPVILLAVVVEAVGGFGSLARVDSIVFGERISAPEGPDDVVWNLRQRLRAASTEAATVSVTIVRTLFGCALVGEGACLYALAAQVSTPFLTTVAAGELSALLIGLAAAYEWRLRVRPDELIAAAYDARARLRS